MPAPVNTVAYPSLETIFNLVRVNLADWQPGRTLQPGEGQITTDDPAVSPQTLTAFNSSLRELYRELRLIGSPTLIRDNVLVALPANGATGPGIQTNLSMQGYFDGLTQNASPTLPSDLLYPIRLWEQQTGTGLPFVPMIQPEDGLPSVIQQGPSLGVWEWRGGGGGFVPGANGGDAVWFIGSTIPTTVRIRYWAALTQFQSLQFTITGFSVVANTVTFTANNTLVAGQTVRLGGFVNASAFNGQTVTVLSSGLSGTQFQVTFISPPSVSDSGFGLPTTNYPVVYAATFVPVSDCEEALALKMAYKISFALSGPNPANQTLKADAMEAIRLLKNEYTKRQQSVEYQRQGYGADSQNEQGYYGTSDNLI